MSFGESTTDGVLVAYRSVSRSLTVRLVSLTPRRVGSLDWQFSNVTADSTYQFVGPELELDEDLIKQHKVFEMRGMIPRYTLCYCYILKLLQSRIGASDKSCHRRCQFYCSHPSTVQIAGVSVAHNASLQVPTKFDKKVEVIGGS